MPGTLYLIPTPISSDEAIGTLTPDVVEIVRRLRFYAVENVRTARRFLKSVDKGIDINTTTFIEIGKTYDNNARSAILGALQNGIDVGVMSEAGAPGIADPGAEVVRTAHEAGIQVMPMVGPSSILLLLMGAGLNGQRFAFQGYLPVKPPERVATLKRLERESATQNMTQVFIETPYRNQALYSDIIKNCKPNTLLSIGIDLTGKTQQLRTQRIVQWRSTKVELPKTPALFAILSEII